MQSFFEKCFEVFKEKNYGFIALYVYFYDLEFNSDPKDSSTLCIFSYAAVYPITSILFLYSMANSKYEYILPAILVSS